MTDRTFGVSVQILPPISSGSSPNLPILLAGIVCAKRLQSIQVIIINRVLALTYFLKEERSALFWMLKVKFISLQDYSKNKVAVPVTFRTFEVFSGLSTYLRSPKRGLSVVGTLGAEGGALRV
jgi:hypothetical protein